MHITGVATRFSIFVNHKRVAVRLHIPNALQFVQCCFCRIQLSVTVMSIYESCVPKANVCAVLDILKHLFVLCDVDMHQKMDLFPTAVSGSGSFVVLIRSAHTL